MATSIRISGAIKLACAAGLALSLQAATPARAEVAEVVLAHQFGFSYLPLLVMKHEKLVEKHLEKAGLAQTKVSWSAMASAVPMNDALISGTLHIASGGSPPAINLWEKTRGTMQAKIFGSVSSVNVLLTTRNPNVKTIADFTDKDRIAMPGAGQSVQTRYLQMEAARLWGIEGAKKLDPLFVNLPHPEAHAALMGGQSEVTAHFGSPPFQNLQLAKPGIRKVLGSYDVMGGPHTFIAAWSTGKFRADNPKTFKAAFDALKEAIDRINADKDWAAGIYVKDTQGKTTLEDSLKLIKDPDVAFSLTPVGMQRFAEFLHRLGVMKIKPESWRDLVFPELHGEKGS
jgi:NitT/TauT family transport system substrate-binding protein